MKVVVTGGGTGGHVYPGIAVAETLRELEPDAEILFVGGRDGLEATAVPQAGFEFVAVPARGLVGKKLTAVPAAIWSAVRGLLASLGIMRSFDPDVVFATGGYVSASVALAAKAARKPLLLHEQNSVPGLTNRLLSRIADEVHLNVPTARKFFPKRRHLRLSGNPIRPGLLQSGSPFEARESFGLAPDRPTVLVMGGSQGARSINRAVVGAVPRLVARSPMQFLIQTGRRDHRWVSRKLRQLGSRAVVLPFIEEMGRAYAAADLVVARAGAMTLAELSTCGKASILVPYPHAAYNHQEENARVFVDAGAAVMILDADLDSLRLARTIARLMGSPRRLRRLSSNALLMGRPDAARKIAGRIRAYARGDGDGNGG